MTLIGVHHVSFTVTDLERTISFYRDVVGMRLLERKHRRADDLGTALLGEGGRSAGAATAGAIGAVDAGSAGPRGAAAEILIADMELGGTRVEFIQYVDPASRPYPGDPSVAGSAHVALLTRDIEGEFRRLQTAGVRFHTPVRTVRDPGKPVWRWCYFRDPDGICVELVESGGPAPEDGEEIEGGKPAANETAADRETALLQTGDFGAHELRRGRKRLDWLTAHGHPARTAAPLPAMPITPRQAFELFFFDYMGLTREQMPVAEETPDRIVWLSRDACPTLEACSRLGLDTRVVCRAVSERPVQVFLSRLDPRLRFVRDYVAIRPYAAHCREQIVRVDVEGLMREAIAEARLAKAEGNKGYGCLVLMGDRVLARAHDTAATRGDPSLHAEHSAILQAVTAWGSSDLTGALLVSTCEPCPMCAGLAVWTGVTTIMFGSSITDTAAMGRTRILVGAAEIAQRSPRLVDVVDGVLREECDALYR
jgi:tRNA(Arg) A34 adenosine deaminase TadA/catechol 2,3-dioxygenase-like lactoylglutathione lyase family enzyme